jgi:hypothetical protein
MRIEDECGTESFCTLFFYWTDVYTEEHYLHCHTSYRVKSPRHHPIPKFSSADTHIILDYANLRVLASTTLRRTEHSIHT